MTRRMTIAAALIALALGGVVLATATAQTTLVVKAVDPPDAATNAWDPGLPDVIEAELGDTVSWEFDQARTIHNLFLMRSGGEEVHLSAEPVCSGPLGLCSPPPDHPDPIQFTFEEEGEYTYYCTVHGGDAEGNGMAGRIIVGEGGGGGPTPLPNPAGPPTELDTCPDGCAPARGP